MVNIRDYENYKKCQTKQYTSYVAMPQKGTLVLNKLEYPDIVSRLGRDFFTQEYFSTVPNKEYLLSQNIFYEVTEQRPFVVAGTLGELSVLTPDELASQYDFINSNGVEKINYKTLELHLKGKSTLNWTEIRNKGIDKHMACFVPLGQYDTVRDYKATVIRLNYGNIGHGKGDFILCNRTHLGKPDFSKIWVVNGEVFANTYNNNGWADNIITSTKSFSKSSLPIIEEPEYNPLDRAEFLTYIRQIKSALNPLIEYDSSVVDYRLVSKFPLFSTGSVYKYDGDSNSYLEKQFYNFLGKYYPKAVSNLQSLVSQTNIIKDSIYSYDKYLPCYEYNVHLTCLLINSIFLMGFYKFVSYEDKTLPRELWHSQYVTISYCVIGNTKNVILNSNLRSYTACFSTLSDFKFEYHGVKTKDGVVLKVRVQPKWGTKSYRIDFNLSKTTNIEHHIEKVYKDIFLVILEDYVEYIHSKSKHNTI